MPVFNTENRKAMSRQIIFIRQELQDLPGQKNVIDEALQRAIEDDNLNQVFFDEQNTIANAYYDEKRSLTGEDPGRITEDDFTESKQFLPESMFFPSLHGPPENIWRYLIPKIAEEVNGSNGSSYSPNESAAVASLLENCTLLTDGFNDGSGSTALAAPYNTGDGTMALTVPSIFENSDRIVASSLLGGGDGLFQIEAGAGTTTLTVTELVSPTTTIVAGSQIEANFPGFSNAERETGSSGTYPTILEALEMSIDADGADWTSALAAQQTAIVDNGESRSTEIDQLTAAASDITDTQTIINTWQSLPSTGSDSRFTDGGLSPLLTERDEREIWLGTRSSEIATALGTVVDNGNGTYSGSTGDIHMERYQWIEARLHRAWGTAIEEQSLSQSSEIMQSRLDGLIAVLVDYEQYMEAQPFMKDGDGTKELVIKDASAFSIGDTIYILDDATAEMQRLIIEKEVSTLYLSDTVPAILEIRRNARIYKIF